MRRILITSIIGMLALWLAFPTLLLFIGLWQCMHQWGWL
jgi:hypothetical protein